MCLPTNNLHRGRETFISTLAADLQNLSARTNAVGKVGRFGVRTDSYLPQRHMIKRRHWVSFARNRAVQGGAVCTLLGVGWQYKIGVTAVRRQK